MNHLILFEDFDYEKSEGGEIVPEQVEYIKKRCLQNIDQLYSLLDHLQHEFSYIPNAKNRKKNKADLIEMLDSAEGMADGGGMTCLWFGDTYYLYVMPVEVAEENGFAEDQDNEAKIDIDRDECIVLVMV